MQLAGVQCAGCPHFWLNADGSYQEEGQRNIKGNLWDKVGRSKISPFSALRFGFSYGIINNNKRLDSRG